MFITKLLLSFDLNQELAQKTSHFDEPIPPAMAGLTTPVDL
jgi:hypothetical protein